jgi:hypothetical protein
MERKPITILETPAFSRRADRLLTTDEQDDLIAFLASERCGSPRRERENPAVSGWGRL